MQCLNGDRDIEQLDKKESEEQKPEIGNIPAYHFNLSIIGLEMYIK